MRALRLLTPKPLTKTSAPCLTGVRDDFYFKIADIIRLYLLIIETALCTWIQVCRYKNMCENRQIYS